MNFWEAYERMKAGEWCQAELKHAKPYRFANGRWETIGELDIGPAVWSEEWQHDTFSKATFIVEWVPYSEYESDPIHFGMEELDATWNARYDLANIPREEDRPAIEPTWQQAALNEKRRIESEERMRLNPPITLSMDALMHDRTGEVLRHCQEVGVLLADRETKMVAQLFAQ